MADIVSNRYLTFARGRKMRRDRAPCPPQPPDGADPLSEAALLWTGYRVELGMELQHAVAIAAALGMPRPTVDQIE